MVSLIGSITASRCDATAIAQPSRINISRQHTARRTAWHVEPRRYPAALRSGRGPAIRLRRRDARAAVRRSRPHAGGHVMAVARTRCQVGLCAATKNKTLFHTQGTRLGPGISLILSTRLSPNVANLALFSANLYLSQALERMTDPMGWQQMMKELSADSNPTEARKYLCDHEMRSVTLRPDVVRLRLPSLSRSWRRISIAVVNRNADVARDHHRSSSSKWRYDEGDHCSREQGYHLGQRVGVDARTTKRACTRSAPGQIRASAGSSRGAGMVPTNRRGASSETLLSLQETVA